MILKWHGIDRFRIECRNDSFLAHVTESSNFRTLTLRQRMFTTAQKDIGLHTQCGQFLDAMLCRLGLKLARCGNVGHKRDVDEDSLLTPQFVAHLTDGFDERQRLDIADGPADFAQYEIEAFGVGLCEFLDLVGDVRDYLHRCA